MTTAPVPNQPRYRSFEATSPREVLSLKAALGEEAFLVCLKLNRVDLDHIRKGDLLVVPTTAEPLFEHAPFPRIWEELGDLEQALVVSLRVQAWAAYRRGQLLRWGPVSTGKKATPTPAGRYHTNWRQAERRSTFNGEWLLKWYVNIHNWEGISFHRYDLPGYPDSHACIRLSEDDSAWIYQWCTSWILSPDQREVLRPGTPVAVIGAWTWGQPRPWRRLPEDPLACAMTPAERAEAQQFLEVGPR